MRYSVILCLAPAAPLPALLACHPQSSPYHDPHSVRHQPLRHVQPIHFLTITTTLVQGAHIGSRVIASLLALKLGANPLLIGLLIGVYSVFPLMLGVYSGRASDRMGTRRPMLAGTVVLGLGLLLPVMWQTLPALFGSAILVGIGFVFFNVSNQNLAGGLGTPEERTRNFSTIGLGYAMGHLVGPVTAGYAIEYLGFRSGYLIFAFIAFAAAAWLAVHRQLDVRSAPGTSARRNTRELLQQPRLLRAIVVSGLVVTGWDLYSFYVPIYGHSIGLSASTIGNIIGAFAIATFIVRAILPRLTRVFGIERVLAVSAIVAALLFVPFPLVEYVPALFVLSFGIGLALGCGQPLTLNLAYNHSPAGRTGEVTGLRLTINNIVHVSVPVAAGALATTLGVAPVFWVSAALLTASGYLCRKPT